MTVFWEITIEPKLLNQFQFFSEDSVLSDEIKICYIFEYQINQNGAFRFFGTPGIKILKEPGMSLLWF